MYDSGIAADALLKDLKDEIDASVEIPLSTYVRWLNSLERFIYRAIVKEQAEEQAELVPEVESAGDDSASGDDEVDLDFQSEIVEESRLTGEFEPVELDGYKFRDILSVYYHCGESGRYPDEYYPSGVELMKVNKGSRELVDNCYYDNGDGSLGICIDDVLAEAGAEAYLTIARVNYPEKKTINKAYKGTTDAAGTTTWSETSEEIVKKLEITRNESEAITDVKEIDYNVMLPMEFVEMVCAKIRYEAYMLCEEPNVAANWLNIFNTQLEDFKTWHELQARRYGS